MRKKIKQSFTNPLISGSVIVTVGTTVGNIFNYLFHLAMGRTLTPGDYGTLTALISFISIFGIVTTTIATVVTKFVSSYKAAESFNNITHILREIYKKVGILAIFGLILFWFFLSPIGSFLNIGDKLLLQIMIIGIILGFFGAINGGALQGLQKFKIIALLGSGGSFLRLALAFILVYFGFGLRGAVIGFFLSFFLPYIITFIPLKKYFSYKESRKKINFGEVLKYSLPALIALGSLGSFMSADIILVKHFFAESIVGQYAALSVIGRVIFFATSSINMVMFPIIAAKYEKKENYNLTFLLSLFLVVIASSGALFFYFFIPKILIKLFYAQESYLAQAYNLGLMGIFFALFSLVSLFINFFLSISKTKIGLTSIIASLLQIGLILKFHSNLREVILSSIIALGLLAGILVLYYLYSLYNAYAYKKK
jgi:O-antigen/teichoic acid export membrane protein